VPLGAGSFERLSALIAAQPTSPEADDAAFPGLPAPLRSIVADAQRRRGWHHLLPGIQALDLAPALPRPRSGAAARAELLRVYPRWGIPRHAHGGEELTLVLEGGFTDETGHFGAGDIALADPDLIHHPMADPGPPCLCFIVSDTAPRFTGALGALTRAWNWVAGRPA
jgi:putative transcriptional regulator